MSGDHNMFQKDTSFDHLTVWLRRSIELPDLARKAGMHVHELGAQCTRFHADLESLDAFAFDIGERRLEHCLEMLRKAGYSDAADFLQGVG
jgi:hypothetical protein